MAQCRRELVDQTAKAKLVIAHDVGVRLENIAHGQGQRGFAVGLGCIFQRLGNHADADPDLGQGFGIDGVHNDRRGAVDEFTVISWVFRQEDDGFLIHGQDKAGALVREQILDDLKTINLLSLVNLDQESQARGRVLDLVFARLERNIARELIFQQDIFQEGIALNFCVGLTEFGKDPMAEQIKITPGDRICSLDEGNQVWLFGGDQLLVDLASGQDRGFIGQNNRTGSEVLSAFQSFVRTGQDRAVCIQDAGSLVKDRRGFAHDSFQLFHFVNPSLLRE